MDTKRKKKYKRYFKEIIFFILWTIVFIKLFIIDIESVLIDKYLPNFTFLLRYRIVFYLFILILLWYILKNKRFFKNSFFFLCFPFYLIFWKIPKVLLWRIPRYLIINKNWIFMYSYINSIINQFWNLRFNIFKGVLLLLSIILTFNTNTKIILYLTIVSQFFLLTIIIYNKFKVAFQPLRLFLINVELVKFIDKKKKSDFLDSIIVDIKNAEKIKDETIDKKKQLEKIEKMKKDNIEKIILIKSLFSVLSSRLKDFLSRRTYIVVFFIKTLLTFITAWFLLSMMNYISFKISNKSFDLQIVPKFFDFIYYTFHSMLHGNIKDILPSGIIAKCLDILAPIVSILITGTLITVFFTVKTEQYRDDLNEIIAYSDSQLDKLEKILIENHNYTIIEALEFLESKKSFVCIIVKEIDKIE